MSASGLQVVYKRSANGSISLPNIYTYIINNTHCIHMFYSYIDIHERHCICTIVQTLIFIILTYETDKRYCNNNSIGLSQLCPLMRSQAALSQRSAMVFIRSQAALSQRSAMVFIRSQAALSQRSAMVFIQLK